MLAVLSGSLAFRAIARSLREEGQINRKPNCVGGVETGTLLDRITRGRSTTPEIRRVRRGQRCRNHRRLPSQATKQISGIDYIWPSARRGRRSTIPPAAL